MKKFQVFNGFCHQDFTVLYKKYDLSHLRSITLVDAPDYVFEGWGYDETKEGDERFIQPQAPEGWNYDPATGTFYPDVDPSTIEPTAQDDTDALMVDHELRITMLELGLTE